MEHSPSSPSPHDGLQTTIPHSSFGNQECCGCLNGVIRGDVADIVCNECATVIRTVPAADLQRTLDEMELALEVATTICPHCSAVNLFPGFSETLAFTCTQCGRFVSLSNERPASEEP